jgi:hypothetical protein
MTTALLILALLANDPDQARITLKVQDMPLGKVLEKVAVDSKIPIEWSEAASKKADVQALVTLDVQDMVVSGALKLLLLSQGLDAKVIDKKKVLIVVP